MIPTMLVNQHHGADLINLDARHKSGNRNAAKEKNSGAIGTPVSHGSDTNTPFPRMAIAGSPGRPWVCIRCKATILCQAGASPLPV
jgi:hypothetical protein